MPAPTLQAQGAIAAVTTGSLTVTLPAHQADDILVVTLSYWGPNSTDVQNPPAPSGWTFVADIPGLSASLIRGRLNLFWLRATSGAETNPVFTRNTGWDTGTDTNWSGRAYTIRGCVTSGTPWDQAVISSDPGHSVANGAFGAVTVSGVERMVVQFLCSMDDQAAGAAPSGWTAGTAVTTTTGTDAGFQTFRKDNVSASTAADASATAAPAAGVYGFFGVSFKPPQSLMLPNRNLLVVRR